MRRRPARDERGNAIVEFVWLGILLLVPLVYIVLSVFEVQRGAYGVTEATRSAARVFSLAPDVETGKARADAAARVAMADQGIPEHGYQMQISCIPEGECLMPGSVVVVKIETHVALPLLPDVLGNNRPSIYVDSTQQVPYGTYRPAQ
jgi:Flp pilus assembly protein TadG